MTGDVLHAHDDERHETQPEKSHLKQFVRYSCQLNLFNPLQN